MQKAIKARTRDYIPYSDFGVGAALPDMKLILGNMKGDIRETIVGGLLPGAFGPWDLKSK
ncbi:hypothetical protein [Paenibacillus sp. DMB20]|uniref:hypothetical protein n=1 Tax=Paenibacillus sp. DMB20 TaxID=1642570 RepID=UPI0006275C40|nr:hypothetical protein [Paenibacillus sp. DMB20]KKO51519.1 hypothetical protein XI25_25835 [Paenibacillus sp. DMB20]